MAVCEILRLGHPALRVVCTPIRSFGSTQLQSLVANLQDTLAEFKTRHGFGRGIAAPQIGVTQRVIFLNVDAPGPLINPVIVRRSRRIMTLWDDCFSFPELMVKLRRNLAIEVRFYDEERRRHTLKAEGSLAELLQHEIDHLNGILTIDRAIDSRHIVFRSEHEKWSKADDGVVL